MSEKRGCFGNIRLFVACYGGLLLTDIMAGVMKKSSLTTIEKRFDLPSTVLALLASSFQIGTLTTLLFVSYLGSRWHRPRTIFGGAVLLVLGNLIVTLPQFLGERYEYEDVLSNATSSTQVSECDANNTHSGNDENCIENEPTNKLYILLIVGMMINGVGGSPIQPLGISYIDDFAHETNSPLYIGLTTSIAMVGPIIGFVLSSVVLKWWVDIGWVDTSTITITPTHPSWVGAWWLGLIICTCGIALTMIPFLFFPKKMKKEELKKSSEKKDDDTNKTENSDALVQNEKITEDSKKKKSAFSKEVTEIKNTVKRLFKNKVFLLVVLKFVFGNVSLAGIANFFPKYLEVQFGVSASRANFLTGVINIPCVIVGTLSGSIIMKRLKLSQVGSAKLVAFATVMASCCIAPLLFIGCDTIDIAGVTVPYHNGTFDQLPSEQSLCNIDCDCTSGVYAPVCGSDGISYVSPCHAGCAEIVTDESGFTQQFTNCNCIPSYGVSSEQDVSFATPERCQLSKCAHLLVYSLGLKSLASFFGGLAGTAMYILLIRSVQQKDKAIAIGVNLLAIRLLAWIPGPLVYGAVMDSACLYWGKKPCTNRAYCKVYDNVGYRFRFYGIIFASNLLSCITIFVLYHMVKKEQAEADEKEKRKVEPLEFKMQLQKNCLDASSDMGSLPEKDGEQDTFVSHQDSSKETDAA